MKLMDESIVFRRDVAMVLCCVMIDIPYFLDGESVQMLLALEVLV